MSEHPTKTIMAVFSNPASAEQEDEYNRWYDTTHLPELLELPGLVGATRYRLVEAGHSAGSEHRYLAIYEVEGDPNAVLAALGSGKTTMSDSVDGPGAKILFWEPLTDGSTRQTP